MRVSSNRLDVNYEARFVAPSVDFAVAPGAALKSFTKHISPRFPIASSDMRVTTGHSVRDVKIRMTLFGGNGVFEMDADHFSALFTNGRAPADVQLIQDCIKLSLDAISESLKADRIGDQIFQAMMWLELKDEPKDARQFLNSLTAPVANATLSWKGAETDVCNCVKFELNNAVEKWQFIFDLTRSYRTDEELFLVASATYYAGTTFAALESKVSHLQNMLANCLKHLDLIPPGEGG